MTPVTRKVRVKVPATSANLGSGFDTVGLALDYHDELEFTLSADPVNTAAQVMIEGEGEDTLPRDETHLVVSTFRRACQTFGLGRVGFILQAHNNIPQARGMGSSAEAIVAGIAAAAAFAQDDDLNRDAVFELAAAIEGHPDNVAPAVYGGLTMSWDMETAEGVGSVPIPGGEPMHNGFHTINYRVADDLTAAVFVPDYVQGRRAQRLPCESAAGRHEPRDAGLRLASERQRTAVRGHAGPPASAVPRLADGAVLGADREDALPRLRLHRVRRWSMRACAAPWRRPRGTRTDRRRRAGIRPLACAASRGRHQGCAGGTRMSIPLILASQSRPRRDVLFSAGICPTIRVSHVDEPAALEREAAALGVTVNDLSVEQRVMILATAKAEAVHQAYRNIADTAAHARGERVVGFPLRAADDRDASSAGTAARTDSAQSADETKTRDFSGIAIPTVAEPIADFVDGRPSLTRSKAGPLILGCDSMFLLDGECYGKPHSEEVARERLRAMRGATGELWTGHCLIDFASGRMVRGASKATLHFCEYSDLDIERYIATGEPLEVAGSFTLEGFGGAFIDSIEGDPHGIIGLSLPLARRLAAQLGVEWTDLWNVTRSDLVPDAEYDAKTGAAKPLPPKENVHQPGDGWVDCACGRKHWGTNGASGVLLARRSETTGEVTHVVMQHRAVWSAEGGTWGIPGGATADGESPIEGALRESYEEANITPEDIDVVGSYCEDHGPWSYTTVFAFEKPGHRVEPKANDDESMEIEWVPVDDVPNRKLLTAMRTDWPNFAARLRALAAVR